MCVPLRNWLVEITAQRLAAARHPGRQPALVTQLLEVGLEREARGEAQLLRDLAPGGVQQLVGGSSTRVERLEQAPLTLEAVLELLLDAAMRIVHERAMSGADRVEVEGQQRPQGVEVGGE